MPMYISMQACAFVRRDDDYGQVLTLYTLFNLRESCGVLLLSSTPLYR